MTTPSVQSRPRNKTRNAKSARTVAELDGHLSRCIEDLANVEARLDAMSEEVRTRRLVVVDERGDDRITASASDTPGDRAATLYVRANDETSVELVGVPGGSAESAYAGMYLYGRGADRASLVVDEVAGEFHPTARSVLTLRDEYGDKGTDWTVAGFAASHNPGACACQAIGCAGMRSDEHEWLLNAESRGFAGAVDLIEAISGRADEDHALGQTTWADFPEFVAAHNWQNPESMRVLAGLIHELVCRRRGTA